MRFKKVLSTSYFWFTIILLILARLILTSDLSVEMTFSPWDDNLYIKRAYHLLIGEAFGPYDGRLFGKYLGISIWISLIRFLGIPYFFAINTTYILAGLYFSSTLLRFGVNKKVVLISFILFLFNPITLGYEWVRILREPLSTSLLVIIIASVGQVIVGLWERKVPWKHLFVFTVVFTFAQYVREDDVILWVLLGLFLISVIFFVKRFRFYSLELIIFISAIAFLPIMTNILFGYSLRTFVENNYGQPILHEMSEGEFPRLLAAIRSIRTAKENRMVMVTQETLQKLQIAVPEFAPIVDRLPKPNSSSWSCTLHGVCSEWSNGWMPFMIKDSAFEAGLTPNMSVGQEYFKNIRLKIELACKDNRLECVERGGGLIPPMEFRWTRAFFTEGLRVVKMALAPDNNPIFKLPVTYHVPLAMGRIYQEVTMTHYFDTELQGRIGDLPTKRLFENPISDYREKFVQPYMVVMLVFIIVTLTMLMVNLWIVDQRASLSPLILTSLIFILYFIIKIAALSYVAVFMGGVTPRLLFPTYAVLTILVLPLLIENYKLNRFVNLEKIDS